MKLNNYKQLKTKYKMKTIVSKKGEINLRDVVRGLIIAAGTSALLIVQQSISAGGFVFDWKEIGMAAVAGGLAYIFKNFLEPSKVITVTNSGSTADEVKDKIDNVIL